MHATSKLCLSRTSNLACMFFLDNDTHHVHLDSLGLHRTMQQLKHQSPCTQQMHQLFNSPPYTHTARFVQRATAPCRISADHSNTNSIEPIRFDSIQPNQKSFSPSPEVSFSACFTFFFSGPPAAEGPTNPPPPDIPAGPSSPRAQLPLGALEYAAGSIGS